VYQPPEHPYRVPFDGSFQIGKWPTDKPHDAPAKDERERRLAERVASLDDLQRRLYAEDTWSILMVFQAMDAAGKDSTIRAVLSGINPAGCQVSSFKQPSSEELDHDFLWRVTKRLPERGRIGVFNRSYYEEVLVVRVHPGILEAQKLPQPLDRDAVWGSRFQSIADYERHLAENGTVVLKFFLHVSKAEQRRRFLDRIKEKEKNWKFSAGDLTERARWDDYMRAYEEAINATSKPWAPWYAIPADSKSWLQLQVAEILLGVMEGLDLRYPVLPAEEAAKLDEEGKALLAEKG
jgi:PPK2 family polyphosphate:nucleotide phosphotransferase